MGGGGFRFGHIPLIKVELDELLDPLDLAGIDNENMPGLKVSPAREKEHDFDDHGEGYYAEDLAEASYDTENVASFSNIGKQHNIYDD